jgi:RimJ/RimL family protein N-acetyltransferase
MRIDNRNCFVCFGGADPQNKTLEIIEDENILKHFHHFHVVVGGAYQYKNELSDVASKKKNISLHYSLPPKDLVSLMRSCSFAICSPSTVMYEYMSVGGIVFLEQIADNQKEVARYMIGEGFAFSLSDLGSIKENEFQLSFSKQSQYFDGKSGERLKKIFSQYFYANKMVVRRATKEDVDICYTWANDKAVRVQSFNQEPITLDEHTAWFTKRLADSNTFYYIMEIDKKPVAQIRFQVTNDEAVLGYLADESIRNKGLGTSILSRGLEEFVCEFGKSINIIGHVKSSNLFSQSSFERLAFVKSVSTEYPDSFKYTMHYDN